MINHDRKVAAGWPNAMVFGCNRTGRLFFHIRPRVLQSVLRYLDDFYQQFLKGRVESLWRSTCEGVDSEGPQNMWMLKSAHCGAVVGDLAHERSVISAAIYNWLSNYGGLDVYEAERLEEP